MHFRFVKILAVAALLPLFAQSAPAQSAPAQTPHPAAQSRPAPNKAETTLYQKTMAKPSVKAADKFLKKYPESVYAQKVHNLKDSLLTMAFNGQNISHISKEEALQKAGSNIDAVGWKKDGTEHIIAISTVPQNIAVHILSPDGSPQTTKNIPVYTLQDTPGAFELALPLEVASPLGPRRNYLHFAYRNGAEEYVEVLYLPEEDIVHQAIFYGNPVGKQIEGQSPEMMEGLLLAPEVSWLVGRLKDNPSLIPISNADYLTDAAIRWWLEKNPGAGSRSARISFGRLDPESSMVQAYNRAAKEKGKNCNAALFNIRGYTVVCVRSRTDGEYSLAWCEPVCRNKNRDKLLNTIYFETDGTTLVLYYYKGKTTFKYRLSTASHTLRI